MAITYPISGSEYPSVGDIVSDLCGIVGVTDVDTSVLDTIRVRGFMAAGGYSAADTIRSLQRAYFFDLPEIDGQLVAVLRGGSSVATITRDDMVRGSEAKFETAREQGVEFPQKLHLAYASAETDYTPTKQTSERRSQDIKSLTELSIEVSINLEADDAAQIADKVHKTAWSEMQGRVKFAVSEKRAGLVPSDPVTVETSTGVYKRIRIQKITAVDGSLQAEGVIDRTSAVESDVTAPGVVDPIDPVSNLVSSTNYELMDLPALLQSHDTLHIYVSAYGRDSGIWNGAIVDQLVDTEWVERDRITYPETMGVLAESLLIHPSGLDETNTILVTLSDDEIESITQAEFDLGGNAALIGNEIINFRDVTQEGDSYRLSYLNRAQLNTYSATHPVDTRFVKLVAPTRIEMPAESISQSVTFRCYSISNLPSVNDEKSFTFVGNSQVEWKPINPTISMLGEDWQVGWEHNKRIGAPNSGIVSAHFEKFKVQFFVGSLSYTLETTNEGITYTGAEQIADFGALVTSFDLVHIYPVNEYTGSGLPATAVDITGVYLLLESGGGLLIEGGAGALLLEESKMMLESGGSLLNEAGDGALLLE